MHHFICECSDICMCLLSVQTMCVECVCVFFIIFNSSQSLNYLLVFERAVHLWQRLADPLGPTMEHVLVQRDLDVELVQAACFENPTNTDL